MKDFIKDPDPETDINLGSFSISIFDWLLPKLFLIGPPIQILLKAKLKMVILEK